MIGHSQACQTLKTGHFGHFSGPGISHRDVDHSSSIPSPANAGCTRRGAEVMRVRIQVIAREDSAVLAYSGLPELDYTGAQSSGRRLAHPAQPELHKAERCPGHHGSSPSLVFRKASISGVVRVSPQARASTVSARNSNIGMPESSNAFLMKYQPRIAAWSSPR